MITKFLVKIYHAPFGKAEGYVVVHLMWQNLPKFSKEVFSE